MNIEMAVVLGLDQMALPATQIMFRQKKRATT
jgi:hypothetical protein